MVKILLLSTGRCVVFFFQAEDGIRDHCVTGVQTCALPILFASYSESFQPNNASTNRVTGAQVLLDPREGEQFEIGRASCRERV